MLLSALIKRCFVSRMQDFLFYYGTSKYNINNINVGIKYICIKQQFFLLLRKQDNIIIKLSLYLQKQFTLRESNVVKQIFWSLDIYTEGNFKIFFLLLLLQTLTTRYILLNMITKVDTPHCHFEMVANLNKLDLFGLFYCMTT